MTKDQALALFGDRSSLATALGVTPARVSQLPATLPQRDVDRIVGAALRLGLIRKLGDLAKAA